VRAPAHPPTHTPTPTPRLPAARTGCSTHGSQTRSPSVRALPLLAPPHTRGLGRRLADDKQRVRARLSRERQEGRFLENLAIYEHLATPAPPAEPGMADASSAAAKYLKRTWSAPSILVPTLTPEQWAMRKAAAEQRKAATENAAAEAMDAASAITRDVVSALATDVAATAQSKAALGSASGATAAETSGGKRPQTPKAVRVHRARAGQSANMLAMLEKLDRERMQDAEDDMQHIMAREVDRLSGGDGGGSGGGDGEGSSAPFQVEQAALFDRERSQRSTSVVSPWMLDMDLISRIRDGIGVYGGAHEWKLRHEGEWKTRGGGAGRHSL
jgi:hypothetical protein